MSQVVTVASSSGRQRCTTAVPKKLPEIRQAPAITKKASQSPTRLTSRPPRVPKASPSRKIGTVPSAEPMNSSSNFSDLTSGPPQLRHRAGAGTPPEVEHHADRERRAEQQDGKAVAASFIISSKAKPPSTKV
ncbi:hypothetical protein [Streptomyces viridochromogenes]|uniref:hypothetical protein n=1 Tax=Streptomyces viridochromogenes TaxID=1938 RepID=UPI001331A3F5|nr:hypothetical protein [Streptomyces viridochromogenes]